VISLFFKVYLSQIPTCTATTGSKMYNRFLRMHAKERGMYLCNHCLVGALYRLCRIQILTLSA
jgi:hypothetical protein